MHSGEPGEEAKRGCRGVTSETSVVLPALFRRGAAREGMRDWEGAERDYRHVLQQEPGNRDARVGLQSVLEAQRLVAEAPIGV